MTPLSQAELEKLSDDNCILNVVSGSHAYGTNIPSSDWDERGVFVDDMARIALPFEKIEQVKHSENDKVLFELSKFMPLLLSQNPNVIELLWTDETDVLYKNECGSSLIANRSEFLSIKVKDSYVGYAMAQLRRIKGHNKWINNPQPEAEPRPIDYSTVVWNFSSDRTHNKIVPIEGHSAIAINSHTYAVFKNEDLKIPNNKSWVDKRGNPNPMDSEQSSEVKKTGKQPIAIVKINFDLFENDHVNWKSYWQWKRNRNEKRSELEEKYGYDTKHAMHLIRLLRSGIEILENGIVPVKRSDAQYLLDVRLGKYPYEEIVAESERLSAKVETLGSFSPLPKEPNLALAKSLMLDIYGKYWNVSPKTAMRHLGKLSV